MRLTLRSIFSPGDLAKERLTLRANADLDIGDYLVAQTGVSDTGDPTVFFNQPYWLPYKKIKSGDLVVIYTKEGEQRSRPLKNGINTAHFLYFHSQEPIWDDPEKGAIVLFTPIWDFRKQKDLIKKSP